MICPPSRSYHRSASSRASASSCSLRRRHHMRITVPARNLSYLCTMLCRVALLMVIVGLLAGGALGWLAARARSAAEVARLDATLRATREGEVRLEQSLRTLSHEAVRDQQDSLGRLLAPLQDTIHRYERRVVELEADRVDAYAELRTEVRQIQKVSTALSTSTGQLVSALRAPQVRGRWGEQQLRRIVEAAGMVPHCDFAEQVTVASDDGGILRPDLVVRLAGDRDAQLDLHAKHLRAHVDQLSAKSYWTAFDSAPEFVVLFVPADPFLDAALQRDPALLEHAFARDVVIATPATLIALLRTVAFAWRQEALSRNAVHVHALGRELYGRLSTMAAHLTKLGASLG